jgi:predicted DNA-binding transcriptional regulator AlpA
MITPTNALCTNVRGVATMLNVSIRTVYRMNDAGALPEPLTFGGLKRWRIAEIEDWLRAGSPARKSWTWSESS